MMESTIQSWSDQYGVNADDITTEYFDLGAHVLGLTTFKYDKTTVLPDGKYRRIALIQIHELLKGESLAVKCVLWHEFCHAEKWLKDGTSDGHSSGWSDRCWRKPILFLLDCTYTNFVFWRAKAKKR